MIDYDIMYMPKYDTILLGIDHKYVEIPRQQFLSDIFILADKGMPCEFKDKKGTANGDDR